MPADQAKRPDAARTGAQSDRLIVLTVANPVEPVSTLAGSTPVGYSGMSSYAAGNVALATVASLSKDYELRQVAAWPIAPLKVHCVVFEIPAQTSREALLSRLARDERVHTVQPLETFSTMSTTYNDPYISLERGFTEIDAAGAQQWSRGDGIRVAVIDTGVDTLHPDLQGRIETSRNFVDEDATQFTQDRHGTEVAGVIAAVANNRLGIVGVAPGVHLVALKSCKQLQAGADGAQCNSFTLAQGLTVAIESDVKVVNLSLGGPPDPLLTQLVDYGLKHGMIIVAAVPPDGKLNGFPVGIPGVIAVDVANSSTATDSVLHAPGREILTLMPGGRYDFASGSSLATAHVTGAIALLLAQTPNLDSAAIFALLRKTSEHPTVGKDSINACAALAALRQEGTCAGLNSAASASATPVVAHSTP